MAQFPRHNSCYMFKKEYCAQNHQIIIAWFGIGKLAEVIKINLGDQYNVNLTNIPCLVC
jgi:hypothetical protein